MKYLEKTFSVGYGGQAYRDGWEAIDWSDGAKKPVIPPSARECNCCSGLSHVGMGSFLCKCDWCDGMGFYCVDGIEREQCICSEPQV